MYEPNPIDTSEVILTEEQLALIENIAENIHELWAVSQVAEGWVYSDKADIAGKTTPLLVPYDELPKSEKDYDINTAIETLKLIVKMGYKIVPTKDRVYTYDIERFDMSKGEQEMETERDKMTKGEPFLTNDPQLMNDKAIARQLTAEYNSTPEDKKSRRNILRRLFGRCGENVFIKPPFHCDYGYNIYLGTNFFANFDCIFLDAAPIIIGDNCMIGPKTCIYAIGHPLDAEARNMHIGIPKPVVIGNNVWIGGGVTILPGVSIGENTVIAAASVVTKSFPENVIIAGNPAKVIKKLEDSI